MPTSDRPSPAADERRSPTSDLPSTLPVDRRSGEDRRKGRRVPLELNTTVPVVVRDLGRVQWGIARNVSEGGMLVEVRDPPSIGAFVEIKLAGMQGTIAAPDAVYLTGEVRHQMAWAYGPDGKTLSAVGIRFVDAPEPVAVQAHATVLH